MPAATPQTIEEATGLSPAVCEKAYASARRAERELRGLLGDAGYGAVDPQDLAQAESLVCLALALPLLALRATEKGGLMKTVGIGQGMSEELMSLYDITRLAGVLREQAYGLLGVGGALYDAV